MVSCIVHAQGVIDIHAAQSHPALCCTSAPATHVCAATPCPRPAAPQNLCDDDDDPEGAADVWGMPDVEGRGPIYFVEGSASEAASLRQAGASTARALIYLARAGATWEWEVGGHQGLSRKGGSRWICFTSRWVGPAKWWLAPCLVTSSFTVRQRRPMTTPAFSLLPCRPPTACRSAAPALQHAQCARHRPPAAQLRRSAARVKQCWPMRRRCWR